MTEMPECPECGLTIEISRHADPWLRSIKRRRYCIICGCPDCLSTVQFHCEVSEDALAGGRIYGVSSLKEYWDLQYETALDMWKKEHMEKERSE